jgi:hypothetical protein
MQVRGKLLAGFRAQGGTAAAGVRHKGPIMLGQGCRTNKKQLGQQMLTGRTYVQGHLLAIAFEFEQIIE